MVRVSDLDKSLAFYKDALGLIETRRKDYPEGKYTLVFLAAPENPESEVELTFNYDGKGELYLHHRDKYPFIKSLPLSAVKK